MRLTWRQIMGLFLVLLPWIKLEIYTRVVVADFLMLISGIIFALYVVQQGRLPKAPPALSVYGSGLLLWIVAVLLSGIDVLHIKPYLFDATALIYLASLSGFLAYTLQSLEDVYWAWSRIYLGLQLCLVFSLVGLFFGLQGQWPSLFYSNARKLISTFKYPNQLAGFLVLFVPWLWEAWMRARTRKARWFYGLTFLVLMSSLLATGSRTGAVVAAFGLMLSMGWSLIQGHLRPVLVGSLFAGAALVTANLLAPSIPVIQRAFHGFQMALTGQITDTFRHHNWALALHLFAQHPFQGYGIANIAVDFGYEIHNTFLAVPAEMGLVGSLALFSLYGYTLYFGWQNIRLSRDIPKARSLAQGLLFGLISEWLFATQHLMLRSRYLWVWMALIVALYSALHQERNTYVRNHEILDPNT